LMDRQKLFKLISAITVLFFLIGIEVAYRSPLFDKSLTIIEDLQNNASKASKDFFLFITNFGTEAVLIPMYAICLNWLPLSKSFTFLQVLIISVVIDNIFKLIYSNPRPYFSDTNITPIQCEGGYGNPSGHSFSSSGCYLAFYHLTSTNEFLNEKVWLKIIYGIFMGSMVIIILFSRLFLGVHSLNQIIYGLTLGVWLYILIFFVLELQNLTHDEFFEQFIDLWINIIYWGFYFTCFLISILLYILKNYSDPSTETYVYFVCPNLSPYSYFQYDGFSTSLVLFILVGFHIGLTILYILVNKYLEEKDILFTINNFIDTNFWISILRLAFLVAIAVPTGIPLLAISQNADFWIIYLFKLSLPYFLSPCILASGIFFAYKLKLTYRKQEKNVLHNPVNKNDMIIHKTEPNDIENDNNSKKIQISEN